MTSGKRRWLAVSLGTGLVLSLILLASLDTLGGLQAPERFVLTEVATYVPPLPPPPPPSRASDARSGGSMGTDLTLRVWKHASIAGTVVDEANDGGDTNGRGGDALERSEVVKHERPPKYEIFRRIARDRELGEGDQVRARIAGPRDPIDDLRRVAVKIAHNEVHLGERDAYGPAEHRLCASAPHGLS